MIMDDTHIAEGSFNWLSASRERFSDYHNHEATFIVDGEAASSLIEHFYQSEVGGTLSRYQDKINPVDDYSTSTNTSVVSTRDTFFNSPIPIPYGSSSSQSSYSNTLFPELDVSAGEELLQETPVKSDKANEDMHLKALDPNTN